MGAPGILAECGGAAAKPQASPKCHSTPTKLLDPDTLMIPDAGAGTFSIYGLAASSTDLYCVTDVSTQQMRLNGELEGGQIFRMPLRGGVPHIVVDDIPGGPAGISVTATAIVYGAKGLATNGDHDGAIFSQSFTGGAPVKLASAGTGWSTPWMASLPSDGQNVYWVDQDGVHSVPLSGGVERTVTTASVFAIAVGGGELLLMDVASGIVQTMSTDGGAPTTVATQQNIPKLGQACGSMQFCWSDWGDPMGNNASVMKVDGTGNVGVLIAPGTEPPLSYLRFDGQGLFGATGNNFGGPILRIPINGMAPVSVATATTAGPIAVDDECVYWANIFDGIYSINKSVSTP